MGPTKIPELIELFNARMDKVHGLLIKYAAKALEKESLDMIVPDDIQALANEYTTGLDFAEWLYHHTEAERAVHKVQKEERSQQN